MNFQILNRWTSAVIFECELSAEVHAGSYTFRLGVAVKKAISSDADLRDADLRDADLRDADLRDADLRGADLRDANLSDADLSGADLSGANLSDADLRGANLSGADLRGANLSGANLSAPWIPKIPNIHQKVYAAASQKGALNMGSWHQTDICGTTHCRAGWVIALAGEGGRVLEGCWGTPAAATAIYLASDPTLSKVPDFYCDNKTALADMKARADEEATR